MNEIDQLEQWRLAAQKTKGPSAPSSASAQPVDELEQWRLQAQQKKQATTPATTPQTKPVEASKPVAEPKKSWWTKPTEEDRQQLATGLDRTKLDRPVGPSGRGFAMKPQEQKVREQKLKQREADVTAKYEADVASGEIIPFEQFAKDDKVFKVVTDFMGVVGKKFDPTKQSREDFVKEYTDQIRFMEENGIGSAKLLVKLNNDDKAAAAKLATGYAVFNEKLPSAGQRGGEGGVAPILQRVVYAISSPENLASLGLGFIAKSAAKQAGKSFLKQNLIGTATAGLVDVTGSAAVDAGLQKAEQDAQRLRTDIEDETSAAKEARQTKPFDLNGYRTAAVTLVSGVLNVSAAKTALSAADTKATTTRIPLKERLKADKEIDAIDAVMSKLDPASPDYKQLQDKKLKLEKIKIETEGLMGPHLPPAAQKAKQQVIDATNAQIDKEVRRYVQEQGAQVLKQIGPESLLADAKIRNDVTKNSVNIALNIIRDNPDFALKPNEKISDAINRVFATMESVGDANLESAMRKENVNLDELAAAINVSTSDAARNLAIMSHASRAVKRLQGIDPAFDAQIKRLYKNTASDTGLGHDVVEGIRRWVDRESKAIMVSGLGTMFSNLVGATTTLPMKSAVRLFEGGVYSVSKATESLIAGRPVAYEFGQNMAAAWEDSTRIWKYLADQNMSKEMTELLLENNPAMTARMLGTGEDDKGVSAVARALNVFNRWQDGIFRRSMFVESVDRQMRDIGFDLMTVIKEGKPIPKDVLAKASDDAMKFTMSYMPKTSATGHFLDAPAEKAAAMAVQAVEMIPTGSVWIAAFPRFMANASSFYYRHSPLGFASVIGDRGMLKRARETGDAATIALAERKARDNAAQAAVGSMVLMAAVAYRAENQETTWDKLANDDGTVSDVKPFFPVAPYLAIADVIVKMARGLDFDAKGAIESISGLKLAAGQQDTFLDQFASVWNSEDKAEEFTVQIGKAIGDWAGRYTKGLGMNQIVDLANALRGDSTVRDPNVLDEKVGNVELPKWVEAGVQRVQKDLPFAKDELASVPPRFGDRENITREGEFLGRIIRAKSESGGNEVVREANRLGLKPFELFGKPTGDKALDNEMIRAINDVAIPELKAIIASPDYQKVSDLNKRERLLKDLTDIRKRASDVAKQNLDAARTFKTTYKAMSKRDKQRINEEYRKRHPEGKSLEEVDDYQAAEGILAELNARIGLNKGGLVQRRR